MAMVISLDHGNKMMKGQSCAFTSGYVESSHLPTMDCDVLVYEGKEYALSDKRITQKNDKTEDESYLILTLFAIGKELLASNEMARTEEPVEIELLAGLPPLHYKAMRKKFEQYFTSESRQMNFELNKHPMSIKIVGTHVFPQAYAAALTIYDQIEGSPIVNIVDSDLKYYNFVGLFLRGFGGVVLKKDEMSFHIRFNNADPRHRKAARILNMVGRQKATIVANALWEYDFEGDYDCDCESAKKSPVSEQPTRAKTVPGQTNASPCCSEHGVKKIEALVRSSNAEGRGLVNSIVATLGQFQD